mgnify:CR=1 FL=1
MAAPQYGVMNFVGLLTRKTYSKEVYISDVANALVNWDSGGGAGATSETFWSPVEPVSLVDFAVVTGLTVAFKLQLCRNGVPTGDMLREGPHTDSVATRPRLNVRFNAGDKVSAIQLA